MTDPINPIPTTIVDLPGRIRVPDVVGIDRPDVARLREVDGVFQGGGALGAAYVGALRAMHDNGLWFARVAGTSAGAITASMIAAGYTAPEIQFLTSGFLQNATPPHSLSVIGLDKPIDFMSFLDVPTPASVRPIREETALWNLLNLSLVESLGPTLDAALGDIIPGRDAIVAMATAGALNAFGDAIRFVPNGEQAVTSAVEIALASLPPDGVQPSDLIPDTTELRRRIADALWDEFAAREPLLPITTNLIHRGGIFHGATFEQTMGDLLLRKSPPSGPRFGPTRFRDLKLPLAVLAVDLGSGELRKYTSRTHRDMPVVDAVRESMSIPFVFEPRRGNADGGLISNFPVWLFSAIGDEYWPQESLDADRLKVGFVLDEHLPASFPGQPRMAAPKFSVDADGVVDLAEALGPVLTDKMIEAGYSQAQAKKGAVELLSLMSSGPHIPLFNEIFAVGSVVLGAEATMRAVLTGALMKDRPYTEVAIPLRGYHSLDFAVNANAAHLGGMWDRAWRATVAALTAAPGPLRPLTTIRPPFAPVRS